MRVEDQIGFKPGIRMGKHEFLLQITIFAHIFSSLDLDIPEHAVVLVLEVVAKVNTFIHPRKRISTKVNTWQVSFFLKESNTFSFTLDRVWIRTELKVVTVAVFLNSLHHLLESIKGRGKNPIVVAISKHTVVVVVHPAASRFPPEEFEQIVHIKAIENSTQYCSLTDTIAETEDA